MMPRKSSKPSVEKTVRDIRRATRFPDGTLDTGLRRYDDRLAFYLLATIVNPLDQGKSHKDVL